MKNINYYLIEHNESYNKMSFKTKQTFWNSIIKMFKGTKLSKELLYDMLSTFDLKDIKDLSDILYDNDNSNFISYQPSNDEFINDSNKEKIINQISDYLIKYVILNNN